MSPIMFSILLKIPALKPWLQSHCIKQCTVTDYSKLSPIALLQLLDVIDPTTVAKTYRPLTHGVTAMRLYSRNAESYYDTLMDNLECIQHNQSVKGIKTEMRGTTFDGWLVSVKDEPYYPGTFLTTAIPTIRQLCMLLIEHSQHESIGYFRRQLSKTFHDTVTILTTCIGFKGTSNDQTKK